MNLIAEISGSYWLALIFQTSHVVSEVRSPPCLVRAYYMCPTNLGGVAEARQGQYDAYGLVRR